jgi:hypothetical protein
MKLSSTILGSTAVKQLEAAYGEHVLVIGDDRFTRRQLASVGCFNYQAARNLTAIVKPFDIGGCRDLYERLPPGALALPHLGVISLAVLSAAFEIKKVGGDDPLGNWARSHAGDAKRAIVTFHTLKHRELQSIANEKKAAAKKRRAAEVALKGTRFERPAVAS